MDEDLSGFLTELDRAESWDDAWAKALRFFVDHGLDWVVHGYTRLNAEAPFKQHLVSTFPDWFQDFFDQTNAIAFDPATRHMAEHVTPALSGPDFVDRERDGETVWRHYQVIKGFGARSGFLVPLRFRIKSGFGGMLLGSNLKGPEFCRFYKEHGHRLHLAAVCADAKLVQLRAQQEMEAVHLTPRECECLLWLSRGLRNDRIAERLGVTNATVELHLANARRKLEAATREQALAQAILLGLVEP